MIFAIDSTWIDRKDDAPIIVSGTIDEAWPADVTGCLSWQRTLFPDSVS